MRLSHFLTLFFLLLPLIQACALPNRGGYDRDRGSYARMPRTSGTPAGRTAPSFTATSSVADAEAPLQGLTSDPGWNSILSSWLGTPYLYGGSSRNGTDCSGFIMSAYREKTGISLPRTTRAGFQSGTPVRDSEIQLGDIIYFTNDRGDIDHAGIYLGNSQFIHSSTSKGVIVTPMNDSYWEPRYKGARRY